MKKIWFLFLIGFLYRIVIGLQGVDGVDAGFCNTFYQVIFSHPDSNVFCFIYYLLGLVGGTWEIMFGTYGLIGFRVLEAMTLTGAITLLYSTFSPYMPRNYIVGAVILAFLFPTIVVTFHYDTFSYFLIAASAYSFRHYIDAQRPMWLLGAGYAIGLAFFVRIVNGMLFVLLPTPLFYCWHHGNRSQGVRHSIVMLVGLLTGFATVVAVMISLGHTSYYIGALSEAFSTFIGSEATHSHGHLLSQYFGGFTNLLAQIVGVLAFWLTYQYIGRWKSLGRKTVAKWILTVGFLVFTYTSLPYLSLLAICLVLLLCGVWKDDSSSAMAVSLYLTVATMVFPFGSDIGIQGIFHWCAGLLVLPSAWCASRLSIPLLYPALRSTICCVAISALARTGINVYGEDEPRWQCTHQVQADRLNVYMGKGKADVYRKTIAAINEHVGDNRLLFCTNQASELYYATKTLPYEGHVQPIIYTGEKLFWRLDERLEHFGSYPLILFLRQSSESPETSQIQSDTHIWMKKHQYRLVYDDGVTELYAR